MTDRVDITWHEHSVSRRDRETLHGHRGCVVWLTGLSGSGKSTVANALDRLLWERGVHTVFLDGDNVRHGLNASPQLLAERHSAEFAARFGLGFGAMDREENIRRIGAVAELFCASGLITITAFVSPYRRDRDLVRELVTAQGEPRDFVEVFIDTPLAVCEARDPKGLYRQARSGQIKQFTGIDDPYEPPARAELVLHGDLGTPGEHARRIAEFLERAGILPPAAK